MKQKLSVTLEEALLEEIANLVDTGKFRNKSHLVEFSINKVLEEIGGENE